MTAFYIISGIVIVIATVFMVYVIRELVHEYRNQYLYWDKDSLQMLPWDEYKQR